jgi:fluoride exporter
MTTLLVVLGGAAGAPARYLIDRMIQARHDSAFPWGTWVVNVSGSFLLGLLIGAAGAGDLADRLAAGLGVGFCGALTTYSTFSYETVRLLEAGAWHQAAANVLLSVSAGMAAAVAGLTVAAILWR